MSNSEFACGWCKHFYPSEALTKNAKLKGGQIGFRRCVGIPRNKLIGKSWEDCVNKTQFDSILPPENESHQRKTSGYRFHNPAVETSQSYKPKILENNDCQTCMLTNEVYLQANPAMPPTKIIRQPNCGVTDEAVLNNQGLCLRPNLRKRIK